MTTVSSIKFKDGDEDEELGYDCISIEVISNGYLVTLETEEDVYKYVYEFENKGDLIALLKESL